MEHVASDSVRICPRCGSINIKSNPLPWKAKPEDVVLFECLACQNRAKEFPIIKKNNIRSFRASVKGKFKGF